MKKIRSLEKLYKLQQQRQKKIFESRRTRSKRLENRGKEIQAKVRKQIPSITKLNVPSIFCFTRNTSGMINFLNELENAIDSFDKIIVNLSDIQDISTDATLAIFAKANNPNRKKNAKIYITSPEIIELKDKLFDSGIFGKEARIFSNGETREPRGIIERKNDINVKSEETSDLIKFATKQLFERELRFQQLQRVFVECMNNTVNHAAIDKDAKESWWASVFYDETGKIARFNFFDNGIGILESINLRWSDKILNKVGWKDRTAIMKDALAGEVGSRTGLSYRGKGLPAILEAFSQGCISNLIIISNDVYVNVGKNEYTNLGKSFKGTFYHWEISEQQRNFCRD
jgi:hypothetical protein